MYHLRNVVIRHIVNGIISIWIEKQELCNWQSGEESYRGERLVNEQKFSFELPSSQSKNKSASGKRKQTSKLYPLEKNSSFFFLNGADVFLASNWKRYLPNTSLYKGRGMTK